LIETEIVLYPHTETQYSYFKQHCHSKWKKWFKNPYIILLENWVSIVGIMTGYGLDDSGVGVPSPGRVKNFLFSTSFRSALAPTKPPIQWVAGALSPGAQQLVREADHLPPTSAEVKKTWIYTSTPPHMPSWHSV
jgi:hypothetical protein